MLHDFPEEFKKCNWTGSVYVPGQRPVKAFCKGMTLFASGVELNEVLIELWSNDGPVPQFNGYAFHKAIGLIHVPVVIIPFKVDPTQGGV